MAGFYEKFEPTISLAGFKPLALEASAGTGKTYSITTIFVRLIAQGLVKPQEILVVTFTELATAQMRDRIRTRLRDTLAGLTRESDPGYKGDLEADELVNWLITQGDPEVMASRIKLALASFDEINISTIHSFCYRMLLQNAFESGTDFGTELVSDIRQIIENFVYDYWTKISFNTPTTLLDALYDNCSPGDLVALGSNIGLNKEITILPEVKKYDPQLQGRWMSLVDQLVTAWELEKESLKEDLLKRAQDKILNGVSFKEATLLKHFESLDKVVLPKLAKGNAFTDSKDELDSIKRFSHSFVVSKINSGKKAAFDGLPPLAKSSHLLDEMAGFRAEARTNQMSYLMEVRGNFLRELRDKLPIQKAKAQVMGFDDLLRNLRDALRDPKLGPQLKGAIRGQFKVAMIDEFQDTDPIQYQIFKDLFKADLNHRLIFIGDPKQSIYSFRMADIDTYLKAIEDVQMERGRVLGLATNWRSDGPYVKALNHLYASSARPFNRDNIRYHEIDVPKHHEQKGWSCSADNWQSSLRLAWIVNDSCKDKLIDKATNLPQARKFAVNFTAQDILRFLKSDAAYLDQTKVKAGDIAVIVSTHRQAIAVARALGKLGIPSVRRSQQNIFQTKEVQVLIWLLRAILNPGNITALKTALVTDFIGIKASDLAALEDGDAFDGWHRNFSTWRETWERFGLMRLIRNILAECNSLERIVEGIDGERRITNYLHLVQEIHKVGKTFGLGPEGQLEWLIKAKTDGGDGGSEEDLIRLESDEEAVKIVTIHAAKGLEFPFVWLPFLWDMKSSQSKNVIFHRDDGSSGIFAHIAPEDDGDSRKTALELAREEQFSEKMRLLYVGLTRAKHACTVVGAFYKDYGESPLNHLIGSQGPGVAGDGTISLGPDPDETLELSEKDGEILGAMGALASGSLGTIGAFPVMPREFLNESPWVDSQGVGFDLDTDRPLTRRLDNQWQRSSFSGMLRSGLERTAADIEGEAYTKQDDDSGVGDGVVHFDDQPKGVCPQGPVDLDQYPRGAHVGDLIHDILELSDFSGGEPRLETIVGEQVKLASIEEPLSLVNGDKISLTESLQKALQTPLGLIGTPERELKLSSLPRGDTVRELEFHLAVKGGLDGSKGARVTHRNLVAAFGDNPDPRGIVKTYLPYLEKLEFSEFHGYLTGFIDLIFRWAPGADVNNRDKKWYVVDYKSNRLARSIDAPSLWSDYLTENLPQKMAESHYFLQYHLYVMVLHRYLQGRLDGYDYERHFGGIYYLFIRGMQGEKGIGDTGIFRDRPPLARIEALSRLFSSRPFEVKP